MLYGMAWLAGFLMVAMMAMIVVDVVLRNLGYQSSAHFFTFTEYVAARSSPAWARRGWCARRATSTSRS